MNRDRLKSLLVCADAAALAAEVTFWRDTLGFEVEYDLGALIGVRDLGTRVVLATPGALDAAPVAVSQGAVLLLEVQDAESSRRGLSSRLASEPGPLREFGTATFFELVTPAQHRVWLISYPGGSERS